MTKPAQVAIQLIGGLVLIASGLLALGGTVGPWFGIAAGLGLIYLGGRAARQRQTAA